MPPSALAAAMTLSQSATSAEVARLAPSSARQTGSASARRHKRATGSLHGNAVIFPPVGIVVWIVTPSWRFRRSASSAFCSNKPSLSRDGISQGLGASRAPPSKSEGMIAYLLRFEEARGPDSTPAWTLLRGAAVNGV